MKTFQRLVRELKSQGFSENEAIREANQIDFGQLSDFSDAALRVVAQDLYAEYQAITEAIS